MKPITFTAKETHKSSPAVLAERILDPDRVRHFGRQNVVPGIATATIEKRTADVIGTRIRVIDENGIIHSIAGGTYGGQGTPDGPALAASLTPYWLAADASGNVAFVDSPSNLAGSVINQPKATSFR